jgi:hypothetical protein
MKTIVVALSLAVAAAPAVTPVAIDSVTGVYKYRFDNGLADGTAYKSENVLEIVKVSPRQAYVRAYLEFFNGHTCDFSGVAELENGVLVYRPHENLGHDKCELTLQRKSDRIVFGDKNFACKSLYCGARGSFNDESFSMSSRRPIRYMPRLLASREYTAALAEHNKDAPPPNNAVKVEPMHFDGSVPHYPRLVAFPDATVRAKVNALLVGAEAHDRKDRSDCLSDLRNSKLQDPEPYNVSIDVTYVTSRYISMQIRRSYNCGGPYPNNGVPDPRTIDLATATDVNWKRIFKPGFLEGDGQLAALYRKRYPSVHGKDADCASAVNEQPLTFSLHLDKKQGLVVEPDFPHAIQACGDEIGFSPADIAPYVQDAGFLADLKSTHRM